MFFFVLFWRFYLFILCSFTLFCGFNSIRPICPIQCNPNPPWMFHRYRIRFSLFMPLNDDSVQFSRLQKPIHLISQSSNLAPNLVVLFSLLLLFCDRDTLILWHGMAWHQQQQQQQQANCVVLFFVDFFKPSSSSDVFFSHPFRLLFKSLPHSRSDRSSKKGSNCLCFSRVGAIPVSLPFRKHRTRNTSVCQEEFRLAGSGFTPFLQWFLRVKLVVWSLSFFARLAPQFTECSL